MLALPPVLTHEIAAGFERDLKKTVEDLPGSLVVDASALRVFDSSALAVLLAARREALAAGKEFSVRDLPARLQQLARLYGVGTLITADGQSPP